MVTLNFLVIQIATKNYYFTLNISETVQDTHS